MTKSKATERPFHSQVKELPLSYEEKLQRIISFASDKPWFDGEMYEDILDQYDRIGYLSDAQMEAIDNVIEGFNIH